MTGARLYIALGLALLLASAIVFHIVQVANLRSAVAAITLEKAACQTDLVTVNGQVSGLTAKIAAQNAQIEGLAREAQSSAAEAQARALASLRASETARRSIEGRPAGPGEMNSWFATSFASH